MKNVEQETPILFRLVSSALVPHELSLLPKPPPPVRSISPEYEDNKAQAEQRIKRAKSVAVNYDWIIQESKKSYLSPPNDHKKTIHVTSSGLSSQLPFLLIAERSQSPRNMRPPVLVASHLSSAMSLPSPAARPDRPIISIEPPGDPKSLSRVRSRRRRGKTVPKERPQPIFWRPDPAVRGKSLGYALGYPGSWAPYKRGSRRYQRDTMRNGIHADATWT